MSHQEIAEVRSSSNASDKTTVVEAPPQASEQQQKQHIDIIHVDDPDGLLCAEKVRADKHPCRSPLFSDGRYLYLLAKLPSPPTSQEDDETKTKSKDSTAEQKVENESKEKTSSSQVAAQESAPLSSGEAVESAQQPSPLAFPVGTTVDAPAATPVASHAEAAPSVPPAQPPVEDYRIYMGDIPRVYDEERVRELLLPFGHLRALELPRDQGKSFVKTALDTPDHRVLLVQVVLQAGLYLNIEQGILR